MKRPIKPSGAANKNGILQPYSYKNDSDIHANIAADINEPNNKPAAVLAGTKLVYKPFYF